MQSSTGDILSSIYGGDIVKLFSLTVDMLCTLTVSICPFVDSVVVGSRSRFSFKSMSKPNFAMKSAPIIGVETSAIVKSHWSDRRNFRSKVNSCCPYVFMMEEFAAWRIKDLGDSFVDM